MFSLLVMRPRFSRLRSFALAEDFGDLREGELVELAHRSIGHVDRFAAMSAQEFSTAFTRAVGPGAVPLPIRWGSVDGWSLADDCLAGWSLADWAISVNGAWLKASNIKHSYLSYHGVENTSMTVKRWKLQEPSASDWQHILERFVAPARVPVRAGLVLATIEYDAVIGTIRAVRVPISPHYSPGDDVS